VCGAGGPGLNPAPVSEGIFTILCSRVLPSTSQVSDQADFPGILVCGRRRSASAPLNYGLSLGLEGKATGEHAGALLAFALPGSIPRGHEKLRFLWQMDGFPVERVDESITGVQEQRAVSDGVTFS